MEAAPRDRTAGPARHGCGLLRTAQTHRPRTRPRLRHTSTTALTRRAGLAPSTTRKAGAQERSPSAERLTRADASQAPLPGPWVVPVMAGCGISPTVLMLRHRRHHLPHHRRRQRTRITRSIPPVRTVSSTMDGARVTSPVVVICITAVASAVMKPVLPPQRVTAPKVAPGSGRLPTAPHRHRRLRCRRQRTRITRSIPPVRTVSSTMDGARVTSPAVDPLREAAATAAMQTVLPVPRATAPKVAPGSGRLPTAHRRRPSGVQIQMVPQRAKIISPSRRTAIRGVMGRLAKRSTPGVRPR
jgi:hypothetical protein